MKKWLLVSIIILFYVLPILYLLNLIFDMFTIPLFLINYENWIRGLIVIVLFYASYRLYQSKKPSFGTNISAA